ncbi:MAG: 50S ribosomal protein L22 [Deltaproteobacteria bacterium]|nr:50S ribosomal protein L22 [Deltaproteobacteria bacterium]MBW2415177.1 50S ribosomal protein L22 [Deltaproteobacteria bacterium]
MEVTAKLRNLKMGCRKGRYVADMIRRRPVSDALTVLQGCSRAAARPIEKLVRSALANAQEKNARQNAGIDLDNLYVKTITVDQGTHSWRVKPRAMGRANWIRKYSSHVTVVLDEK